MAEYDPGVCNIGRAERRKRYILGVFGFASAGVGVWKTGIATPLEAIGIFLLLVMGFEGVYQGRTGFCAAFGHLGIYDVSDNGKEPDEVVDHADRRADQWRAVRIHAVAIIAATATLAALLALIH